MAAICATVSLSMPGSAALAPASSSADSEAGFWFQIAHSSRVTWSSPRAVRVGRRCERADTGDVALGDRIGQRHDRWVVERHGGGGIDRVRTCWFAPLHRPVRRRMKPSGWKLRVPPGRGPACALRFPFRLRGLRSRNVVPTRQADPSIGFAVLMFRFRYPPGFCDPSWPGGCRKCEAGHCVSVTFYLCQQQRNPFLPPKRASCRSRKKVL